MLFCIMKAFNTSDLAQHYQDGSGEHDAQNVLSGVSAYSS